MLLNLIDLELSEVDVSALYTIQTSSKFSKMDFKNLIKLDIHGYKSGGDQVSFGFRV